MSKAYSAPSPANGSRGRHGHTRSGHSKYGNPDISSVDLEDLHDSPQMNTNALRQSNGHAPGTDHRYQQSHAPSHISHSGDDLPDPEAGKQHSSNLQEILTGFLVSIPYILSSALFVSHSPTLEPEVESGEEHPVGIGHVGIDLPLSHWQNNGGCLIKTSVLASATLLLIGLFDKLKTGSSNRDAHGNETHRRPSAVDGGLLSSCFIKAMSVWLPLFASLTLGGERVALAMLIVFSSGLPAPFETRLKEWTKLLRQWKMTLCFLVAMVVFDLVSVGSFLRGGRPNAGYAALILSIFLIRPPFRNLAQPTLKSISTASIPPGFTRPADGAEFVPKTRGSGSGISEHETTATLLSGAILSILTFTVTSLLGISIDIASSLLMVVVACSFAVSLVFSSPRTLDSSTKTGLVSGSAFSIISTSVTLRPMSWPLVIAELCLGVLGYIATYADGHGPNAHTHSRGHSRYADGDKKASRITLYLLQSCEQYPLLHSILREKDSRRIFYFMSLNFVFMLVQLSYGFATGSLGLLSDSIHMFFDCLALVVGLCAAVMSKWPPSARFPYGYGKVDTLAGFANGIFLMIISIEIVYEAVERLLAGSQMQRIGELLVVSAAGLCVNLVGIMAFDHAHHGHGHSHGHSHGHGEGHEGHSHSHSHHANENMHGIFLHILADTLGSVAVVISTILVHFYEWPGFDPLASCIIAILIFVSAIPLVSSTAKMLLLSLPADVEYSLRDTLAGVSSLRGVVGCTVPKFWLDDIAATTPNTHDHSGHGHQHQHQPHHDHHHDHSHDHHHHHHHETPGNSHGQQKVLGVIHVIASQGADLEDVRQRTVKFLRDKSMDVVVQVERESDGRCWCGSGNRLS